MNKRGSYYRYLNRFGWLCVTPAMILFCIFLLYPILSSLYYVTRKWKGATDSFVGLGNFVRMAQDSYFMQAISHNFIYMAIQIPLMIFLALVLAVILNQGIGRMRGAFRTIFFLPCVTSLVAYSVLFRILLQSDGLLNNILINFHVLAQPIGWLSTPFWANVANN